MHRRSTQMFVWTAVTVVCLTLGAAGVLAQEVIVPGKVLIEKSSCLTKGALF